MFLVYASWCLSIVDAMEPCNNGKRGATTWIKGNCDGREESALDIHLIAMEASVAGSFEVSLELAY